ncbi:hypothetical protein B566_EDAN013595 [Ephemera danica]|nr:hypothetical protein B566_EDAN013595 [Ephemera danica]
MDCPEGSIDFRSQQCAEFNKKPFEDRYYDLKVVDGTRCDEEKLDVCVDGQCKPVGCDMMLGSGAHEDRCRECGGDSTGCNTVTGHLDFENLVNGYNDILLIPAGATNILIQEQDAASNYLAVRNVSGFYYLNGNFRIDYPRDLRFAGTIFHYERRPYGFFSPETLTALGPTTEPVYVVCDKLCGEGMQKRSVICFRRNENDKIEVLDDGSCPDEKPMVEKSCMRRPCEGVDWMHTEWSGCNKCGLTKESRIVKCSTEKGTIYPDSACEADRKPESEKECESKTDAQTTAVKAYKQDLCFVLRSPTSVYRKNLTINVMLQRNTKPNKTVKEKKKNCSKKCGGGEKTRKTICYVNETENFSACDPDTSPFSQDSCNNDACEGDDLILDTTQRIDDDEDDDEECEEDEGVEETTKEGDTSDQDGTTPAMETEATEATEAPMSTASPESDEMVTGSSVTDVSSESQPTEATEMEVTEETITAVTKSDLESSPSSGESSSSEDSESSERATTSGDMTSAEKDLTTDSPAEMTTEKSMGSSEESSSEKSMEISTEDSMSASVTTESSLSVEQTTTSDTMSSEETSATSSSEEDESKSSTDSISETVTEKSTTILHPDPEADAPEYDDYSVSPVVTDMEKASTEAPRRGDQDPEEALLESKPSGSTTTLAGPDDKKVDLEEGSGFPDDEFSSSSVLATGSTISDTEETRSSTVEGSGMSSEYQDEVSKITGTDDDDVFSTMLSDSPSVDWTVFGLSTTRAKKMCKPKPRIKCTETPFGCCNDGITKAKGPFKKGCKHPETCKESKHGCCDDGVSPALGPDAHGCPTIACTETLFGCCPDGQTEAQGNDNEGCKVEPPTPFGCCSDGETTATNEEKSECPKCETSKFGCCPDGEQFAKGEDNKGCDIKEDEKPTVVPLECINSIYGCCPGQEDASATGPNYEGCNVINKENCELSYFKCCPDGVKAALGPKYEGCELLCADEKFGCCEDKRTPAHGPNQEGCCLGSLYGCCPDNVMPAKGPNFEGCECDKTKFGCCPDKQTTARGPKNEGCGCQYTEHGCCPDGLTEAAGPDYQECCGCEETEFGCCSDKKTIALGSSGEGCGCVASEFGCCPDGETAAEGEKFEGCVDIPDVFSEASCMQPKDRGTCRDFTVKWFYDTEYGGCSRFWYGGCEGNSNRFTSQEESACYLPKIAGPCEGYYPIWYYDQTRKQCGQFVYGGCLGNNNKFQTREECEQLCVLPDRADACEQPLQAGPCRGNFPRWYYNKETRSCQSFTYGGCKGNDNNFQTEHACLQQCQLSGGRKVLDVCALPKDKGPCPGSVLRWFYDALDDTCKQFAYGGCQGNPNRFRTQEECEARCHANNNMLQGTAVSVPSMTHY